MADSRLFAVLAFALSVTVVSPVIAAGNHGNLAAAHDSWRLAVARDGFSGEVRCTLRSASGDIVIKHGGVGFRFGRHADTLTAWYRIDRGAAVRWQDRYPTLIADDVPVDGPGLRNPTGGIVWLPIDEVRGAQTVTIRPTDRSRPHSFSTAGLETELLSARQQGCTFDVTQAN